MAAAEDAVLLTPTAPVVVVVDGVTAEDTIGGVEPVPVDVTGGWLLEVVPLISAGTVELDKTPLEPVSTTTKPTGRHCE